VFVDRDPANGAVSSRHLADIGILAIDRFAPKVAAHLGICWTSPDADRHKATTVDVASDKHVLWFAIESAHANAKNNA
jgi:hypothetical protein